MRPAKIKPKFRFSEKAKMKDFSGLFILSFLFLPHAAFSKEGAKEPQVSPSRYLKNANAILERLPGPGKCLLDQAGEELGISLYSNMDSVYNQNQMTAVSERRIGPNSCRLRLAKKFYAGMGKFGPKKKGAHSHSLRISDLESHDEVASILTLPENVDPKLKAGWLWDRAMKFSGGNSTLAMNLIGICGHDTINNSFHDLKCPSPQSYMFVPASLGENVTVSQKTIWNVIAAHQDDFGVEGIGISAKYYHVIGAARLGCALKKCNATAAITAKAQAELAMAYRGIKLCTILRKNKKDLDDLLRLYKAPDDQEKLKSAIASGRAGDAKEVGAMILYLQNYVVIGDMNICTDYRNPVKSDPLKDTYKCPALVENCEAAKKKLNSWMMDFEWTREQHNVGSKFGYEKCSSDISGNEEALEEAACRVLSNELNESPSEPEPDASLNAK